MERLSREQIKASLLVARPEIHNLLQSDGKNMEDVQKVMKDVYDNIILISTLIIAYLRAVGYRKWCVRKVNTLTSAFRFILMRCMEGSPGGNTVMINRSYVDLLSDLESVLLAIAFFIPRDSGSNHKLFYKNFEQILDGKNLRVSDAFKSEVVSASTMLQPYNFIISDVDSVLEDLISNYSEGENQLETETLLIKFLQFFNNYYWMINNNPEQPQELFLCTEAVLQKTLSYLFCTHHRNRDENKLLLEEDIWKGILKALVTMVHVCSSSTPAFTDELLVGYGDCIQHILILIKRSSFLRLRKFDDKLGHMVRFCVDCTKHYDQQEQLSDLRKYFQTCMKNMGSIVFSFLSSGRKTNITNEISLWLFDFFVGTIGALLFQLTPPLMSDEILVSILKLFQSMQHNLVLTINNKMKEKMARKMGFLLSGLVVDIHKVMSQPEPNPSSLRAELLWPSMEFIRNVLNWLLRIEEIDLKCPANDQSKILYRELLFVTPLLIDFITNCAEFDSQSDMRKRILIHLSSNNEEMKGKLEAGVSPRISDMLMIILKDLVVQLDNCQPLTAKIIKRSFDCINQILIGLLKDEIINFMGPRKNQLAMLYEELGFLVPLLTNYESYVEHEKLFDEDRIQLQAMAHDIGSLFYSSLNNAMGESMATEENLMLPNLIGKLNHIKSQFMRIIPSMIINRLRETSPDTDLLGFINFLIGDVKELNDCKLNSLMHDQFQIIHSALVVFSSFVQSAPLSMDNAFKDLLISVKNAAYEAEYLINSFVTGGCHMNCLSSLISELTEEIKIIEAAVCGTRKKDSSKDYIDVPSPALVTTSTDHMKDPMQKVDDVVGFEDEMKLIMDQLTSTVKGRYSVSISGMPGLGKTTLAKKVYEHSSTVNRFKYRAWCCVSQEYHRRESLLTILSCIVQLNDEIHKKRDEDLWLMLYQELRGRRYLIVMDDIWGIDALEELKLYFPDNGNGSRLILTSRSKLIGSKANYHLELGNLDEEKSWALLKQRVFQKQKCPRELCQVGQEIANKCRGLPLAIVVVGGLLSKSDKKLNFWKQVAENFHTALDSQEHGMEAVNLSYKFLPAHLKPLFLYLGAFPEDKVIRAESLKWLWVAEGVVRKTDEVMSLEAEAEINLVDLTHRNLLMVVERRYDGRVKTVSIHDLLREISIKKAEEEKFLQWINVRGESPTDPIYCRYRVSISQKDTPTPSECPPESLVTYEDLRTVSMSPPLHSLLHFNTNKKISLSDDVAESIRKFKLLRVLHFESIVKYDNLLSDTTMLIRLRYVSIRTFRNEIPSSISSLKNLETLIVKGLRGEIVVPVEIWKIVKLRHIHISNRARFIGENSSKLENLETLSTPAIYYSEEKHLFKRLPNVRKLRCLFVEHRSSRDNSYHYPQIECLDQLESLKVISGSGRVLFSGEFGLPTTLKKLTLLNFRLPWNQISSFRKLPNLEVLKLRSGAVDGELWELGDDDEFPKLKVLKLENLNIKQWSVSANNFPCLEKLAIERCKELEAIPSSLGEFNCLVKMEVLWCSHSVATSVMHIKKYQKDLGDETLNVHIYPPVSDM